MKTIDRFTGEYRWLSNFWPTIVWYNGEMYGSVEHAYQAAKTLDTADRAWIRSLSSPWAAKRAGRSVVLRKDWETYRLAIMYELVRHKFEDDDGLRAKLLATGDAELVEGNHWGDTFWGVCGGKGRNELGKILMRVRGELRT